jgi:ATP-dependent Clp protease adaptor protein ClpS
MAENNEQPVQPPPNAPEPEQAPQPAGPATAVADRPAPAPPDRKLDKLPPFKVLLHNDDVNSVEHVIKSVVQITPLSIEQSVKVTIEAHETGVALLLVTHKERAELYCEQFQSKSLKVTMEEA